MPRPVSTAPATTPQPADGLVTQPGVLTGVPPEGRNPNATEVMSEGEHEMAAALAKASHIPVSEVEKPVSTAPELVPGAHVKAE